MKRSMIVPLTLLMLLSGCLKGTFNECPKPTVIPVDVQVQAAKEIAAMPADAALRTVVAASLDDRDKMRACNAIQ